ncbi:winged helix-turn-helix domain-containing protein [Pragia fontium]|uniref:DNA-binding winged helix-turn-helix (WHTH) domain-containing protein n=2 Tax=Pragia fontium TaxID=82985 RepID=A0AAJ4W8P0_9GAMM|nr:winged helix-turn-helix domain-containing protein [Pragia fontium]GKX62262.1 transcriptional regulator [Pragia fontium]SFC32298.1 DNA-binding winged helix-turn-helix (wHTH) domain-containing protein [Pragia fontium DSM 5563 = ATCC 49100]VEJ54448.1 DNA-binding transcriptional activator CadC [Pragia fontium]
MIYLINNNIVYNTEDRTLVMQQDDMSTVMLSNSSNRLLYELLYNYGQTVSRDTLFQNVWDNHGLVSSNSNLNHYISQLRKNLISFGLSDKIIITIPKVGFKFSEKIPVMILDSGGETPRAENETDRLESIDLQLNKLTSEILVETQIRHEEVDEPLPLKVDETPNIHNNEVTKARFKWPGKIFYISLLLLALISAVTIAFFAMEHKKSNSGLFLSAKSICPIYTFYPLSTDEKVKMVDNVDAILKENNISCGKEKFVMVHYNSQILISLCSVKGERTFSCSKIKF